MRVSPHSEAKLLAVNSYHYPSRLPLTSMPLDLSQVPTDDLIEAIHKRYPTLVVAGCNDTFIAEHISDLFYIQGNVLTVLGLWDLMHQTLLAGFAENISPNKHDAP